VGATYERSERARSRAFRSDAHETNLERLSQLLAQPCRCGSTAVSTRFAALRWTAPRWQALWRRARALDPRFSLRGAHLADLPRRAGLYCSFALGSRGLALAPLLGELVACLIEASRCDRTLAGGDCGPARFLCGDCARIRRNDLKGRHM